MKSLLVVLSLLVAFTASAALPTANSSWDTIKNHSMLDVAMPSVMLDNGGAAAADFMCIAGDVLRTKKMIKTCNEWQRRGDNDRCIGYKHFYGITKIDNSRTRCVEWRRRGSDHDDVCTRYETYNYTTPTNFNVKVYKVRNVRGDSRRVRVLFTKELNISDCK